MKICILFSIRSGSHWLANLLSQNGINPGYEMLYQMRPGGRGEDKPDFPVRFNELTRWTDLRQAVEIVFNQYSIDGKMSFNVSRAWVISALEFFNKPVNQLTIALFLRHVFDDFHLIYLYRRNQIAQNLSAHVALRTGTAVAQKDYDIDIDDFSSYEIQSSYAQRFRDHFMGFDDVVPYLKLNHRIAYEDLLSNTETFLSDLGQTLGIELIHRPAQLQRRNRDQKQELGLRFCQDTLIKLYRDEAVPPRVKELFDEFTKDL